MSSTPQSGMAAQTWNAEEYAAHGRFVADLAGDVLAMLNPQPGERILDLGCGDGALTERLVASGAEVVACDLDPSMVTAAARRGLTVIQADMRGLPFRSEFDAVFSNAALHWVTDQEAVLNNVHAALKPSGRFVAEMGGHGNIAAIRVALASVLRQYGIDAEQASASTYPSANGYCELLQRHGFSVRSVDLVPRPTLIASGMDAWLRTFRAGVLNRLNAADRENAIARCIQLLEPVLRDSGGRWWADYVRLRFHAVKSGA